MLRCKDFVEQFASDAGDAGWRRRWAWRVHLWMCEGCRRFAEQVGWIGRTARVLGVAPLAPEEELMVRAARERAMEAVQARVTPVV